MTMTVLFTLYGLSFYYEIPKYWETILIASLIYCLFAGAVLRFIPHFTSFLAGDEQPHLVQTGDRTYRRCGTRELGKLCLMILAVRLIELLLTYVVHYIQFGYAGTFFEIQRIWLDFYHAESAFPMYTYLSNIFWIFTFNFNHARFIGSYVFTAMAGAALYALVLFDFDRKTARRAVRYFFFLPISCLLMGSVPDGLFLLLSILALLFMRKRQFWAANMFGMLAAGTHALGMLLFFPILIEYISYLIGNVRSGSEMGKGYIRNQIFNAVSFILIPIGVGLVMLYASLKLGDPLTLYRAAFGNTTVSVTQIPGALFRWIDSIVDSTGTIGVLTIPSLLATVLPQLLYLIAACILILIGSRKIEPSYLLLMILTIPMIFLMNQTGDAAHLITITAPFCIVLAASVQKRWLDALLTSLFILAWLAYFYAFITGYAGGVL